MKWPWKRRRQSAQQPPARDDDAAQLRREALRRRDRAERQAEKVDKVVSRLREARQREPDHFTDDLRRAFGGEAQ